MVCSGECVANGTCLRILLLGVCLDEPGTDGTVS